MHDIHVRHEREHHRAEERGARGAAGRAREHHSEVAAPSRVRPATVCTMSFVIGMTVPRPESRDEAEHADERHVGGSRPSSSSASARERHADRSGSRYGSPVRRRMRGRDQRRR